MSLDRLALELPRMILISGMCRINGSTRLKTLDPPSSNGSASWHAQRDNSTGTVVPFRIARVTLPNSNCLERLWL